MNAGQDAALVIGINDYPSLAPLTGAITDARLFAGWLRTRAGLPSGHIELVTSSGATGPECPTLAEVDAAFDRILTMARGWSRPRRLYVYFAGHGCSREVRHLALLMANATLGNLNRAANATEYQTGLRKQIFPEQVYFFDCCRAYDQTVLGRGPEWTDDPAAREVPGLTQIILYAAGFTEYATEQLHYGVRRGLFTTALMEGLEGAAAVDDGVTGGVVTTGRLKQYVHSRVKDLARRENVVQQMTVDAHGDPRELVLADGISPRRQPVKLIAPDGTTHIRVRDNEYRIIRTIEATVTPVEVRLEMGPLTFEALPGGATATADILPDSTDEIRLH
ncbi:caspase domain-containing protein [Dactylosporangium sp. NPDC051541]|uniref:caspase domain-containing protein n=1 Tax=Dactylosporangium sp. NPDC051541 TaxID=3363977 RepID=UPI00378A5396